MKRTLEEHISRIKELSLINEVDLKTNQLGQDQTEGSNIIDSDIFKNSIEKLLPDILSKVSSDINKIGNQVGDRDGTLEPINTNTQLQLQGESIEINEVGLAMAGGVVLAVPKVIEMIGKGTKQLGKTVKNDWIRSAGEAVTKAGIDLHHTYGSTLLGLLKRIPKYKEMSEEKQKAIADGILLAATVALGISAVNGVQSAIEAGHSGIAALESGLGGVKGIEVGGAARLIIPNILNGIFK